MQSIKYRPDVDGLRAVAVIAVIIFHLNPKWLPGGFVGVDIFFVISGFIITTAMYLQMQGGTFSFSEFYIKRVKRILPLFYLVSFSALIFTYLFYMPEDFVRFADSLRYASTFIANVYFEKKSGYFAPSSEVLPLLHIWSLSVEEQFYFVWPLTLLCLVKLFRVKLRLVLSGGTLVAFVAISHYFATQDPNAAYYFLHNRFFEMFAGALLAIACNHLRSKNFHLSIISYQLFGFVGFTALLLMFFIYNENMVFPGLNAFWVVLATVMLVCSGERKESLSYRLLSIKPMVFVGKLSYSLYLWHWPIIAFYNYYFGSMTVSGSLACLIITMMLSFLSWKYVETPLRFVKLRRRWVWLFYLIIPIVVTVAVAKNIAKNEGYENRFEPELIEFAKSQIKEFKHVTDEFPKNESYQPFKPEILGQANESDRVQAFVWGDSHADHFRSGIDLLGKKYRFSALYGGAGGCPPLLGVTTLYNKELERTCKPLNDSLAEVIKNSDVAYVFLGARWSLYTETSERMDENGPAFTIDAKDSTKSLENSRRVFKDGLERTVNFIVKQGKVPILFEQVAEFSYTPKSCWMRQFEYGGVTGQGCDSPRTDYDIRQNYYRSVFDELAHKYPELVIVKVRDLQCNEQKCKSFLRGQPIYRDNNHLNYQGAIVVMQEYLDSLESKQLKSLFNEH